MMLMGSLIGGGFVFLFTQYLQMVEGLPPVEAGLWMMPYAAGSIIGILAAPMLARRFPSSHLIASGLLISSVGYLMVIWTDTSWGMLIPILGSVLLLMGVGPLQVLSMDLIIGSAPPEKAGAASSLSETSGELGMALGIAVMGSIGTVIYRNRMDVPDGIPNEAAESASDTLAAAMNAAEQLPAALADEIRMLAQAAFASGFQVVGILSSVLLIGIAVISMASLRDKSSIKGNE